MRDVRQLSSKLKWMYTWMLNVQCIVVLMCDSYLFKQCFNSFGFTIISASRNMKILCIISINRHYIYSFAFCPPILSIQTYLMAIKLLDCTVFLFVELWLEFEVVAVGIHCGVRFRFIFLAEFLSCSLYMVPDCLQHTGYTPTWICSGLEFCVHYWE
jgi:hypothetical protein